MNRRNFYLALVSLCLLSRVVCASSALLVNGSSIRLENGQSASLSPYGVNGSVTLSDRCFIVSLTGGTGLKRISTTDANLNLNISGDNYIYSDSSRAISCAYNLTISGPGSLVINQSANFNAIVAGGLNGGGNLTINRGAVVSVNMGLDISWAAVYALSSMKMSNAALHVNSIGAGIYCDGGLAVDNSVLTVISKKAAIVCHDTGRLNISLSTIHLSSSGGDAAMDLADGIHGSPEVAISSSVVTICGAGHGIKTQNSIAFDNVVGIVSGRNSGIAARPSLSVSGAASDLVIAGNVAGENTDSRSASSQGCGIYLSGKSLYSQSAGKVRLFSPGHYAMACTTNAVTGGQLEIGGGISWSDVRKTYTLEAAAAALEAGIGCATQGPNWGLTDIFLANLFTAAWNSSWTLFKTSSSLPLVGMDVETALFLGGRHSIKAAKIGVVFKKELDVANSELSVEGEVVGICDADASSTSKYSVSYDNGSDSGVVIGPGGSLSVKGGSVGVMLCGVVWQREGSFVAEATNGESAMEISSWPFLSGYALSANGGFLRDAGTFSATSGGVRVEMKEISDASSGGTSSGGTSGGDAALGGMAYKVVFKANGGKGRMAAQTITRDQATKLRKNAFKRKGYVFVGWAKKKNGAVAYANAASVKNIAATGKTATLYAVWAKKNYKVVFYANGGNGTMAAQKMTYGKAAKLRTNNFTRKNLEFKGWAISMAKAKKGKVKYQNKAKVKNLTKTGKAVKLYAVWGAAGLPNGGTYSATIRGITWRFNISKKKATVIGCWGYLPKHVSIPSELGGRPVTCIGSGAFQGYSGLKSVTIPGSVTSIGDYAFTMSHLTSIKIPNSVTSIGRYAFGFCSGLTKVTIPGSVTSIGPYAFSCSGLKSVTIPGSVTSIGPYAFSGSGLTKVTIGNGVKSIGERAFQDCGGLTTVTIGKDVTSIEKGAFNLCSGLTKVTIGNGVKSIGDYAFNLCSGLKSVTIPDSVTSIGDEVFSNCFGLTSITIPDSVTSMGDWVFDKCTSLMTISIPAHLRDKTWSRGDLPSSCRIIVR